MNNPTDTTTSWTPDERRKGLDRNSPATVATVTVGDTVEHYVRAGNTQIRVNDGVQAREAVFMHEVKRRMHTSDPLFSILREPVGYSEDLAS
ncbi:hypothetical protein [Demequina flava]|uniref:hypothetical protein n=1 Tax=Demequina flava TaxID=1095025 RepID=UPI000781C071|nr:hypothetical protein [Demequina flava]